MPRQTTLSTTERGYGSVHQKNRAYVEPIVLAGGVECSRCGNPILPHHHWHLDHTDDRMGYRGVSHAWCNVSANAGGSRRIAPELEVERDGLGVRDERWAVPWLGHLRRVPPDAVWPRLMTVPHERAVGSLGPELVAFAEQRSGHPLRWWQQ